MSTRYVVLIISAVIMVASFVSLILANGFVRKISFYSLLGSAVAVIIAFILVAWADHERLRTETQMSHSQLHRQVAVYQATNQHLEEELMQMRRVLFGHVLSCRSPVNQDFDVALTQLLSQDSAAEGCDG